MRVLLPKTDRTTMKKFGIWIALFLMTVAGVIAGWNWSILNPLPKVVEASFRQNVASDKLIVRGDAPMVAPRIHPDRLLNDLNALSFVRYEEGDRRTARSYIVQQLQEAGWQPQSQTYAGGVNLYAERGGTDPEAGFMLLGAHYDSVEASPGADDNASAIAAVLEMARLFHSMPTPRGLRLVFFDQEEAGLLGSFAFANDQQLRSNVTGAIILEMIGFACHTPGCQTYPSVLPITPPSDQGNFLAVIGDQGHMPLIDSFTQASRADLPPVFTLPVPLLGPFMPDLLRSDHAPFWKNGIGAVMVTDTANFRNPHYHQPGDTPDTLDPPFFAGSTQIVVNALTQLLHHQGGFETSLSLPQHMQPSPTPRSMPL